MLGAESGNLACLEIRGAAALADLPIDAFGLLAPCPSFQTPAGQQYFYRCTQSEPTRKLTNQITLYGQGDEIVTYPTVGYGRLKYSLLEPPTLSWAQHCELVRLITEQQPATSSNVHKFKVTRGVSIGTSNSNLAPVFLDNRGNSPAANLNNAVTLIESDPDLAGLVWYDEFLGKLITGNPSREWRDTDDLDVTLHIQRRCGVDKMTRDVVSQAVVLTARHNKRNCVTEWLDSLEWDKTERIADSFTDYFSAKNTLYTRAAAKNFWLSLVARAYRPGCQADNMIVLEGHQGTKKSSALRVIGGDWFVEQHEAATNAKAFAENIQGKLLVEISEMDAFNRSEVTKVKQIITCLNDRYRDSYARYSSDHPRRCIFAGTTNRDDWNRDETGARRFWPVRCSGEMDVSGLAANREQLFAEAVHQFKAGVSWWEMPFGETSAEQDERYEHDVWQDFIVEWIALKTETTAAEVLTGCLKFDTAKIGKFDQMRVAACLRHLGWIKKTQRVDGKTRKTWMRE